MLYDFALQQQQQQFKSLHQSQLKQNTNSPTIEKAKRHYNSEVDPARYRKVIEEGITKFACSICGNTYKWRKSLNKHWKEKHITETPPPLDAPVTVKLRNGNTTINCLPNANSSNHQPAQVPTPKEQKFILPNPSQMDLSSQSFATYLNAIQQYLNPQAVAAASAQVKPSPSPASIKLPAKKCEISSSSEIPLDLSMKPRRHSVESEKPRERSQSANSRSSSTSSSTSSSNSTSSSSNSSSNSSTSSSEQHQHQSLNKSQPSQAQSTAYNQKLFICSVCDAKFHIVDQINEHFLKNHYNEYQRELSSKSPPRNTNVAQQNEEWNLSDPANPLKCIKCDFVGRWPTELQKHAASHSTSRPFKCLICSLTYKWRWDLAKHFDRTHPSFRNPYKKRDRDAARSSLIGPNSSSMKGRSRSNESNRSNLKSRSPSPQQKLIDYSIKQQTTKQQTPAVIKPSYNQKFEQISINPHTPPSSMSSSSSSSTTSSNLQLTNPLFSSISPSNAMYAAYLTLAASQLQKFPFLQSSQPTDPSSFLAAMASLADPSSYLSATNPSPPPPPPSSSSSSNQSKKLKQELDTSKVQMSNSSSNLGENSNNGEKEARNFLCFWCDFRGRWRSEIIQHMRCHHASEKPYRCSACMYASNWKWDVQKHTKKQHPNNVNAKIVEIPDQVLFPDLKDFNFFDNVKPVESPCSTPPANKKSTLNLTPPSSSSSSSSSSSTSSISSVSSSSHKTIKPTKPIVAASKSSLCCQQCPYVACNLSDLRRHLIVHSNEQPYHCCACDFKSKWKSDVKKHQRSLGHAGPILVGKKAMQKVIENLGLDKSSIVSLYGPNIQVIDNKQCKSNEKLIDEDNMEFKQEKNRFLVVKNQKRKREDETEESGAYDDEDYEQLPEDDDDLDEEEDYERYAEHHSENMEYVEEEEEDREELIEEHYEQENNEEDEDVELEIDQDDY